MILRFVLIFLADQHDTQIKIALLPICRCILEEDFSSMSDLLKKNNIMRNLSILFYLEIRLFVTFIDFTFFL